MQIARHHVKSGGAPFECAKNPRLSEFSSSVEKLLAAHWSLDDPDLFAAHDLFCSGIPAALRQVPENDVPTWLWRHEAAAVADRKTRNEETTGENSIAEPVRRISGGWTYQGWKGGYFDSEKDALAFFEEIQWLLLSRKMTPELAVWRNEGVFWAYGIGEAPRGAITDFRTGGMRPTTADDIPPHGVGISGYDGSDGADGIMAMIQRDAMLGQAGFGTGANLSASRSGVPSGAALEFDVAARRLAGETENPAARRITLDADDAGAISILFDYASKSVQGDLRESGRRLAIRHLDAIAKASRSDGEKGAFDPDRNPALRLAIAVARGALVPDALIDRVLRLVGENADFSAARLVGDAAPFAIPRAPVIAIRTDDSDLAEADENRDGAESILDTAALTAWSGAAVALHYSTAADDGNTCSGDGSIASAAGDGDFLFFDNCAASRMTINLSRFVAPDSAFDAGGLRHTATLAALASDIALAKTVSATPRQCRQAWEYRPIALSPSGLAPALMALGVAYDSADGRAFARSVCGLITGAAWRVSAVLAEELGPFPAWERNATSMQETISRQQDRCTSDPAQFDAELHAVWQEATEIGARSGYRNAQVSLVAALERENRIAGCETPGIEPEYSLLRFEKCPGDGYRRTIRPSVVQGLRRLGYDGERLGCILRHVAGHATLKGAPGVNHENLRRRGFTEDALCVLEAGLAECPDISFVFTPWALGAAFCTRMLGLSPFEIGEEGFDMLSALGYSHAAIEAANRYCCGSGALEGAPGLEPDHLAVFDCAVEQGDRNPRRLPPQALLRMMETVQPVITGGIGHVVTLPADSSVGTCREIFIDGWRKGLKTLTACKEPAAPVMPPAALPDRFEDSERRLAGWTILDGGAAAVPTDREPAEKDAIASSASGGDVPRRIDETAIAVPAGQSAAARGASPSPGSLSDPARSSASAGLTPDAATEQRHL